MRVLITSVGLDNIGGVQILTQDLAAWLLDRGHSPVVYGPFLGNAAEKLRRLTVPVVDDLALVGATPDVIHGNGAIETMAALWHFPSTPALFVCHAFRAMVPRSPRILRYVGVDDTCADRLIAEQGIPTDRVRVILNAADMKRFRPRSQALPERPRRALVFSNPASELSHLPLIREACEREGIVLDTAGASSGTHVEAPESILGRYDVVFAKAKCAIEAMASGAAVIVCDTAGLSGMVRSVDLPRLRRLNFGLRSLDRPITVDALRREIAAYDPVDAAVVSAMIRETASTDDAHAQYFSTYEEVLAEDAGRVPDREAEGRAAAAFLQTLSRSQRESTANTNLIVQATHRILRAPVIGPATARIARWLLKRGRRTM